MLARRQKGKGKEHDKGQANKEGVRNNNTENRMITDWLARPHNDKEFTYTKQALYQEHMHPQTFVQLSNEPIIWQQCNTYSHADMGQHL